MLTDACPSALLAPTAPPPVLTDACPSAILALTAYPPVLADAGPSTLLACTADPPVLAFGALRWHTAPAGIFSDTARP